MTLSEIDGEPSFMRRFVSRCGHVHGVVAVGDAGVAIHEWSSAQRGHTARALQELRDCYGTVTAIGIGADPADASWRYWLHMARKGLVDRLEDDDHAVVALEAAPRPVPRYDAPSLDG